jgi:hypothetical protein
VADHGKSEAVRELWGDALGGALKARAAELTEAAVDRGDAVGRALVDALARAQADGRWSEIAELAHALDGHRRARAGVVPLDAVRAKRSGKG